MLANAHVRVPLLRNPLAVAGAVAPARGSAIVHAAARPAAAPAGAIIADAVGEIACQCLKRPAISS